MNVLEASDEELMDEVSRNQPGAFEEIVRRYENRLLATAHRHLRNPDIAEDIVQETFTTIWQDRCKFNKNIAKFSTWIYIILQQKIDKYLRQSRKYREMISLSAVEEDKENLAVISLASDKRVSSEVRLNKLREIILKVLDDKEQLLYKLKDEEGLSYQEISQREPFKGLSPATLMKRRQRYKDKLIKILTREGIIK